MDSTDDDIDAPIDIVVSTRGIAPAAPTGATDRAERDTPTLGDRITAGRGIASRDGPEARGSLACGGV